MASDVGELIRFVGRGCLVGRVGLVASDVGELIRFIDRGCLVGRLGLVASDVGELIRFVDRGCLVDGLGRRRAGSLDLAQPQHGLRVARGELEDALVGLAGLVEHPLLQVEVGLFELVLHPDRGRALAVGRVLVGRVAVLVGTRLVLEALEIQTVTRIHLARVEVGVVIDVQVEVHVDGSLGVGRVF